MTGGDQRSDDATVSRRKTLGLIGSSALGATLSSGVVGATPGRGKGRGQSVGPCTCGSCPEGTFCGKIEGAPEAGKTYTFSSDDDEFSVTIDDVTTKEGEDEVTCFQFSSDDLIEKVCVKGGPDTATYTGDDLDGSLCAPTNPGGQQAEISNVSFCGTEAEDKDCYQIDLAVGDPIEDLGGDDTYHNQNDYLTSFCVCSDGDESRSGGTTWDGDRECRVEWDSFAFDADSEEATVSVKLLASASDDSCKITFAGYRLPEGVTQCPGELEEQEFVTADTKTLQEGETEQFSISLK